MFKAAKATTVKEYFDMLPPERREPMEFLHNFIQKAAPSLMPHFPYNMIGYGSFPYKNAKKEMAEWPVVALANQKNYISVYVCAIENGEYLAEKYKKELGKVSVGKSCIRLKKIEDLDLSAFAKLLKEAAKKPGVILAGEHK